MKSNLYKHMKIHNKPTTPASAKKPTKVSKVGKDSSQSQSARVTTPKDPSTVSAVDYNSGYSRNDILLISDHDEAEGVGAESSVVEITEDVPLLSTLGIAGSPNGSLVAVQEIPADAVRFYQQHFGTQEIQLVQTIQPQDFVNSLPGSTTTFYTSHPEFFTLE